MRSTNFTLWLHEAHGTGVRPARIFVDEARDHAVPEAALVIEHVMRDAEAVGDLLRVVNVLAGAACPRTAHGFAMIVELEGDPDHLARRCARQARP